MAQYDPSRELAVINLPGQTFPVVYDLCREALRVDRPLIDRVLECVQR